MMSNVDVCSCNLRNASENIDYDILKNLDLAFSWSKRMKLFEYPLKGETSHSQFKRFLDLQGLAETEGFKYSRQKAIFDYYRDGDEQLSNQQKYNTLMKLELSAVIQNRHFIDDIIYYVEDSSDTIEAIKLAIKHIQVFNLLKCMRLSEILNYYSVLMEILIQNHNKSRNPDFASMAVDIVRTFCEKRCVKRGIFVHPNIKLEFLLRILQLKRFNLGSLWRQDNDNPSFPLNWSFLSGDYRQFKLLLLCGARNEHSPILRINLQMHIKEHFEYMFGGHLPEIWNESVDNFYRKTSFSVLQVVWLFKDKTTDVYETTDLLVLLWKCIPDPFLTRKDFTDLSDGNHDELNLFLQRCWEWYSDNLTPECINKNHFSSPRSLLHLAKCSIRRSLTENFQIPSDESFDMSQLKLPKCLEEYLRLGVNLKLPQL